MKTLEHSTTDSVSAPERRSGRCTTLYLERAGRGEEVGGRVSALISAALAHRIGLLVTATKP